MKIEVKERGSKNYYDEFLYIISNYRKFRKNPNKKVHRLTINLLVYDILLLFSIIILLLFYVVDKDHLFIFLIGMLSLLFIFMLLYLIMINIRIKQFMSSTETKIININNVGVEYADNEKNIRIKWEEVAFIIINKHTICFLPKARTNILISLTTKYRKEVIKGLDKYNKTSLLIDNNSN